GEVHHGVDTVQGPVHRVAVAHVARLEIDVGIEITGPIAARVDLRIEVVEGAHLMAVHEEPVGQVRADEAGAPCDQRFHGAREATAGRVLTSDSGSLSDRRGAGAASRERADRRPEWPSAPAPRRGRNARPERSARLRSRAARAARDAPAPALVPPRGAQARPGARAVDPDEQDLALLARPTVE